MRWTTPVSARSPSPSRSQCVVPKLKGLATSFAKKLLKAANCALGRVTKKKVRKRSQVGKVISQKTKARKTLAQGRRSA